MAKATRFSRLTFDRAIRLAREKHGLPQEDFAERANVHRTCFSSIELGEVNVGIEVANSLVAALGLRLSELVRRGKFYGKVAADLAGEGVKRWERFRLGYNLSQNDDA